MSVSTDIQHYSNCLDSIHKERDELSDQIEKLRDERHDLRREMFKLEWDDHDVTAIRQRVSGIEAEIEPLIEQQDALHDETMELLDAGPKGLFMRPEEGFSGMLSKPLGPLPCRAKKVDPTAESLATVGDYRIKGFLLLLLAVTCLISLVITVPWTGVSPGLFILGICKQLLPWWVGMPVALFLMYQLAKLLTRGMVRPTYKGKALDQAAMFEEQWFRMGAESWSPWRRIYSCLSFGAVHLVNVIYSPASLIVVGCIGGVFMLVYLREYQRSGSRERAVLASTKLHAAYNRFAFLYMGVAVFLMVGLTIAQQVM